MALKRFNEDFALTLPAFNEAAFKRVTESIVTEGTGQQGLQVTFAAIHEGLTRNDTFYTKEGLTNKNKDDRGQVGGLESWTSPYKAPILKNHDPSSEPLGRVQKAEWKEKAGQEKGHVEITALITDPDAIGKFLRGEYETGSIGMDVDRAECSICSADRLNTWCEHQRGKWYKKAPKGSENEGQWLEAIEHEAGARRAHIQIGNVWAREYSVVQIPSDMRSKVKAMQVVESVFTEASGESISLMEAPHVAESVTDPQAGVTSEPTGTENETTYEKSIAELCNEFRTGLDQDVLSLYTGVVSELAVADIRPEGYVHQLTIGEGEQTRGMFKGELEKFAAYILENNEDLEDELNEIKESVLSSTSNTDLPDSAFALVKTVGEKTIRVLPFKDASGKVEAAKLVTALARWNQISGFTFGEAAKGLKKLRAAALKKGFGSAETSAEELAVEIESAKEFLAQNGITLGTEAAPETATLQAKIAELTTELKDATTLVEEREVENSELVEKLAELSVSIETAKKTDIINKITVLEGVSEADLEAKVTELMKESVETLTGSLETLETAAGEGTFIVTRLPKTNGQALSTDQAEKNEKPSTNMETVISAFLGSKRAKAALETEIAKVKTQVTR
jgi:predicted transcriptional regulator